MIRKLKVLGLGVMAALAVNASVGSAASVAAEFHATGSTHIIGKGEALGPQVFETPTVRVACAAFDATGTVSSTTVSEVTLVTPEPTNCVAVVGGSEVSVRLTATGCDFLYTNETQAGGTHYKAQINCSETVPGSGVRDEIDVEVFVVGKFRPCYAVPQQKPTGGGLVFENNGDHIDMKTTFSGIEYTKLTGVCGPAGTQNDATLQGEATISGVDTVEKPWTSISAELSSPVQRC